MAFNFEEWCNTYELNDDTVKFLTERGFSSKLSLSVLCTDDVRKDFKKLQPAQVALLELAVREFHSTTAGPSVPPPTSSPPNDQAAGHSVPPQASSSSNDQAAASSATLSVEEVLRKCGLIGNTQSAGNFSDTTVTDPYGFGTGPFAWKFKDLTKYVSDTSSWNTPADSEESLMVGDRKFVATDSRRLMVDKLSPQQYMEASLSVLREMVVNDNLPTGRAVDHLNYLIQIARFAQKSPWQSVLRYDQQYRRQQSELGFRWGTGSPILMQSQLTANTRAPPPSSQSRKPQLRDSAGRVICLMWNSVNGCNYHKCKYAHVCRECNSHDHTYQQHNQQKN